MQAATVQTWSPLVVGAKLVAPRARADTVARERVIALLDAAAERPLTVVTAAAGYGKTTAVATWLATLDGEHAWLSLDALDNDPRRLCAHVLAAIDRVRPGVIRAAQLALNAGSDPLGHVVPLAVGALEEHGGRLILVLDDLHRVTDADCLAFVTSLIDALPDALRLVVCSREMPPLRLARGEINGSAARLGADALAFQGDEPERLLNGTLALGLQPGAVDAIVTRVEGWPAGLALIASSLAGRPARQPGERGASMRGVAQYLVEEVLASAEPRLREFLIRTSILGRLNGPLCAAVLEDPAAYDLLAEVRCSNLFVTVLDEPGDEWLRYHHLFAELLERVLRARTPELVRDLHLRAAAWFAANGLHEEAIAHAIAAGDGQRAAALLYDCWPRLMGAWRYVGVRRMIAAMPLDRGALGPFCEALDTVCWSLEGADMRLVEQRLDALEPQRSAPGVAPIIDRMRLSPFYGDVGGTARRGAAIWARQGDQRFRAEIAGQYGMILWFAGQGDAARDVIEPYLYEMRGPAARSWAFGTLSLVAGDEGDVELAEHYGRRAVGAMTFSDCHGVREFHYAHTALADALRLRGALDEAEQQLVLAARLTSRQPGSLHVAFTRIYEARLALTRRDRNRVRACTGAARAIIDRLRDAGTLAERLAAIEAVAERPRDAELRGSLPSAAERRVLDLLPTELTFGEIAARLFLSEHTVGAHRRRIYRRLGASSREHAVRVARERGLL